MTLAQHQQRLLAEAQNRVARYMHVVPQPDVVEIELTPTATMYERMRARTGMDGAIEAIKLTLEESK